MSAPLVGPREHERAGAPPRERRPHLPVEGARLRTLAVAQRVEPQLAHEERPIAGDVLQAGEVCLEPLLGLEVHVEAHDVEERQLEVFGRRVVHIRHDAGWVLILHDAIQSLEVAFDPGPAEPARHRRWDLIAKCVAQQRRVARAGADLGADQRRDVGRAPAVDEVADVLLRAETDHDPQAVAQGGVEQGARRRGVRNADGIDAVRGHLSKVTLDAETVVVLPALGIRLERAVGHPADVELLVAYEEELALGAQPRDGGGGEQRRLRRGARCRRPADEDAARSALHRGRQEATQEWHRAPV